MTQLIPGVIVGLREGLEAFLIIGLILEYLNKIDAAYLKKSVHRGILAGLGVSVFFGVILWLITLQFTSSGNSVGKLWEAGASLAAVLLISYFIYWMIQHGQRMKEEVRSSVQKNLSAAGILILTTAAIAREGAEIALFAFTAENKGIYTTGTFLGLLFAAVLAYLIYKSMVKVNIGTIFKITLVYLILQAAYLSGYAIHELISALKEIGMLNSDSVLLIKMYNFKDTVLDHKTGVLGIFLNISIGWYSRPEIIQFFIHLAYLAAASLVWIKKTETPKKITKTQMLSN
ncbi:MAG: FTR1 family protein [Spirochaetia bacterium]|nr:FTR1 family protein [Spirochaetia bacterium]